MSARGAALPVPTFEEFFRGAYRPLLRDVIFAGGTPHEAEDAVSAAMVEVFQRWDAIEYPRAYAHRAAISNLIKNKQRGLQRIRERHGSVMHISDSRITTLHPRTYRDARAIGEHFREGTPVIMNLTDMADSDARRLVDFAAGLIFGLRGSIDRVTNKVFLLSPANAEVAAEDEDAIAERAFFNQS